MTLLDLFSNLVAAFLADLILKATLVLVLAAGLAKFLRNASAAVRHRVWTLSFAGLLVLPVLSYVMPELRLPILPAEMIPYSVPETPMEELSGEIVTDAESPSAPAAEKLADRTPEYSQPQTDRMRSEFSSSQFDPAAFPQPFLEQTEPFETVNHFDAAAAGKEPVESEDTLDLSPAVVPVTTTNSPASSSRLWLWIWGGGLCVFLLPVVIGLLQNLVLRRLSQNVSDSPTLDLLALLRGKLSIRRSVRLIESGHSHIPLTWGLWSPIVLFPQLWQKWTGERKRLVLLHELAHIKRWDVACQLFARVVCAIYWFHPLCWYAFKRLKNESELACDDCVLMTGESPQQYASELVDIARSVRRRIYPAAVAMSQASSLEQRIRALLDRARSRLPLGGRLAALLLAVSLLTVGGIAAVKPVASEVVAETESQPVDGTSETSEVNETSEEPLDEVDANNAATETTNGNLEYIRGTVVGPNGKPVACAHVRYIYRIRKGPLEDAWLTNENVFGRMRYASWVPGKIEAYAETTTDENGRYELSRDRSEDLARSPNDGRPAIKSTLILASADAADVGSATTPDKLVGWINEGMELKDTKPLIRLMEPESGPIRGRLVNLEGDPVIGARITIENVSSTEPGEVDRWLKDVERLTENGLLSLEDDEQNLFSSDHPDMVAARFPFADGVSAPGMIGLQPVVSDDEGRFEIPSPGDDCLFRLRIESPGYINSNTRIVTREMERVMTYASSREPELEEYLGSNCTIVLAPSQPVTGVIRDADTQEPIPGVTVVVNQGEAITKTDGEGKYSLDGIAPGEIRSFGIYPPMSTPYLVDEWIEVPRQNGTDPIELNLDLAAGVWIEGRVLNRATGEGVPDVRLSYTAFRDNPYAERYTRFHQKQYSRSIYSERRFMTDEDGRYRLRGIPGRGIVQAYCPNSVHTFRKGVGGDKIPELEETRTKNRPTPTFDDVEEDDVNAIATVDLPADATSTTLDLELDPGQSFTLHVQDPDGKPLENYMVGGVEPDAYLLRWPIPAPAVEITGLTLKESRLVLLLQKERQLGRAIVLNADEESQSSKAIRLQPLATFKGRFVDGEGNPVVKSLVQLHLDKPDHDTLIWVDEATSDDDGRFELTQGICGGSYRIFHLPRGELGGILNVVSDTIAPKPGETIDFGDIELTSDERPESVRIAAKTAQKENESEETSDKLSVYRGTVVDPDGKSVAGASVKLLYSFAEYPKDKAWLQREGMMSSWPPTQIGSFDETTTDENGRYELVENWSQFERENEQRGTTRIQSSAMIVASVDAQGTKPMTGWIRSVTNFLNPDNTSIRLQTANGEPIQGRLIDLEGRPLANARVSVELVAGTEPGAVDRWLSDVKRLTEKGALPVDPGERSNSQTESPETKAARFPANEAKVRGEMIGLQPVTTDDQGRFEFPNPGDDCLVMLRVESDGYATVTANVVTRAMQRVEARGALFNGVDTSYIESPHEFHGLDCTIVVPPSQPVVGVILDADTKKPIPGLIVTANQGEAISETDTEGRYRLDGLAPGSAERMSILTPDSSPYFAREFIEVPKQAGTTPVELNFDLRPGIWIEGRVVNRKTGKGQPIVSLHYTPYLDNPHAKRYPTFNPRVRSIITNDYRFMTDSEGRFRLRAIPGRGIVLAVSKQGVFRTGIGADSIEGLGVSRDFASRLTYDDVWMNSSHSIAAVDISADEKTATLDLEVDPGGTVTLNVQDLDGKPLQGYKISGQKTSITSPNFPMSDSQVEIQGLSPKELRPVLMLHEERKLGRLLVIDTDAESGSEKSVKLQPLARLTGRLLDANGKPVEEAKVAIWVNHSYPAYAIVLGETFTDGNGRFEYNALLPGGDYRIFCYSESKRLELTSSIVANPGETIDFGDIDITQEKAPEPKRMPAKTAAIEGGTTETAGNTRYFQGTVVDLDGKPVAGADVAVIAWNSGPQRGGDYASDWEILATGQTDADGQFQLKMNGVSEQTHRYAHAIARKPGSAIAWSELNLSASETDFTLNISPEQPLGGRLIDIDGKPAGGVKLIVKSVTKTDSDRSRRSGVGYYGVDSPDAWLPEITTDAEGRFAVHGLPEGFGLWLEVTGSDRFAPQEIALNTGLTEQRGERDGTYRPLVKNAAPGEEILLVLAPAQVFEGVVRFADSGEPAPHARLTIWASQQEFGGSMVSVAGQADAQGRYHITAKPGVRFGINVYPPDGTPYLTRRTPYDQTIVWKAGDEVKNVDIALQRGVLIKGQVVEKGSGKPVAKASVQYLPETVNNDNTSEEFLTGWQGIQVTDAEGRFEMAVLPGPGRLLAHGPDWKYVPQEISSREISRNEVGGTRSYAHAIEKIDPETNSDPFEVTLELQPGETVSGRLVDEEGEPVDNAVMITQLAVHPTDVTWRASDLFQARDGRFELNCLAEGEEYPVHFLDAEHKLGATVILSTRDKTPTVVLKPCGQARMRVIDKDGKTVADHYPDIHIVVTPGVSKYNSAAFRVGMLAADTDFISNVDRTNYPDMPKSDQDGELLLPVLIPGATYQLLDYNNQVITVTESFKVQAGETIDLGDVLVKRQE